MAKSPTLFDTSSFPREVKNGLRKLYYDQGVTKEDILGRATEMRISLTPTQLDAILSEPDDLADFRMHKFNRMIRDLERMAEDTMNSITEEDLATSSVSQRTTLLRTCIDQVQRLHDLHVIHMEQNEDFKLARLLAMGREEARNQLMERFRSLAHVLFGAMTPDEVMTELNILTSGKAGFADDASRGGGGVHPGGLRLVKLAGGGEDDDRPDPGPADGGGSSPTTQGVGAFRGVKER